MAGPLTTGVDFEAVLRRLVPADLSALSELYRRRLAWMQSRGIDQWRAEHADRDIAHLAACVEAGQVLGAQDGDGALVAAVCVSNNGSLWSAQSGYAAGGAWYLEKLLSDPDAAAGSGAALLEHVVRLGRQAGTGVLRMDCMSASRPLLRFWQARGFLPRAQVRHGTGLPVTLHERRLAPLPGRHQVPALPESVLDDPFIDALRATLLFVVRDGQVLLIHKKRGHGAGKINGPGGKCDPGESPRACAIREVAEELLIDVAEPEYRGELRFIDSTGERIHGFVFVSDDFTGVPTETDEAIPEWFALDQVPYQRMWGDDLMWLPWVLQGEGFRAAYLTHEEEVVAADLRFGAGPEPT